MRRRRRGQWRRPVIVLIGKRTGRALLGMDGRVGAGAGHHCVIESMGRVALQRRHGGHAVVDGKVALLVSDRRRRV